MSAVGADECRAAHAASVSESERLASHALHALVAALRAALFLAEQCDEEDCQAHHHRHRDKRPKHAVVIVSRFGLHRAVEHLRRSSHAVNHTAVPVARLETRHHALHLYALRHGVGHGALQAVAHGETHLALVGDEEDEQSVVALLLAYAPLAEQIVSEVEDVCLANAGQHHHSRLDARAGFEPSEHGVDRVARRGGENVRRVGNVLAHVAQTHVGHVLQRVLLRLARRKRQRCDERKNQ